MRELLVGDYQEMAVKVYHNSESTYAAKEIAKEILLNSGWSEEDIKKCEGKDPKKQVMVILA